MTKDETDRTDRMEQKLVAVYEILTKAQDAGGRNWHEIASRQERAILKALEILEEDRR